MNDREIVDLYWQRSEKAIAETDRKYGRYCHIIAYNILENREDSEECVDDTWLGAWNSMPDKRPEHLSPFLGRITRNLALKKIARRNAKKRGIHVTAALEEIDACIPSGYDLEKELEDKELSRAIDHFLGQLSKKEQLVFVSRYWFLAQEREIAERIGLSRSGVSAMLKRIRSKLKTHLESEGLCTVRKGY